MELELPPVPPATTPLVARGETGEAPGITEHSAVPATTSPLVARRVAEAAPPAPGSSPFEPVPQVVVNTGNGRPVALQRTAETAEPAGAATPSPEASAEAAAHQVAARAQSSAVQRAIETVQRVPAPAPAAPARPSMPVVAPSAPIQRAEDENRMTVSEPAPPATSQSPDIDELFEQVWRKLERRLRTDRERQFGLP